MKKHGILTLLILMMLSSCKKPSPTTLNPAPFHTDDEYHVYGMIIADFPSPKEKAVSPRRVRRFCSVAEMLSW